MRWIGGRESGNVEDRRGSGGRGLAIGGGIGTVVIAIIVTLLGGDPSEILNGSGQPTGSPTMPRAGQSAGPQADDAAAQFTRRVLASTEDTWGRVFAKDGEQYRPPVLVMFRDRTQSGCGIASAASGPFYCPGDGKLYIDLSFYDELARRFNAPGDFAMAYVVAHEVGHYIQDQMGIMDKVRAAQERVSEAEANRISVRLELQADFLAGVWAHNAQGTDFNFEPGDVDEALRAANSIGDDRIQQQTQGYVTPDAFTHGTAAQRVYWFSKGLKTGDINQGDTFSSREDANLQ